MLFSRLFFRRVIVLLAPVEGATDATAGFSHGLSLVAVDPWKTQWTIVEGFHEARANHEGVWFMPYMAMDESFVFTLREARALAGKLIAQAAAESEPPISGIAAA